MRGVLLRVFSVRKRVGCLGGGPRPLAAPLPSPWNPLFISPWEGEGEWLAGEGMVVVGGGCCGHGETVVVGGGTSAMGVVGAVREPPLRVGRRERGWVLR